LFCGNVGVNAIGVPTGQAMVIPPAAMFTSSENVMLMFDEGEMFVAPLAGVVGRFTFGAASVVNEKTWLSPATPSPLPSS
jgi:hypothetical protein